MSGQSFCLVDCNNFYVSCERVFNPKLENKPVVILSNNDGCIISRSNEAKELGIDMGAPLFEVEHLIRKYNVEVFSSNYTLYGDMSDRIMTTLEMMVPDIELYSIDEAFLVVPENNKHREDLGQSIKNIVKQNIGIPVSVGMGETKTLAKVANKIAKKYKKFEGVLDIISHPKIDKVLDFTKVGDVWGVGRKYAELLNSNGIFNALQLRDAPDNWVKKAMTITGLKTVYELRGISCIKLEQVSPDRKTIVRSGSFSRPTSSLKELKEAVAFYISRAAEKLREQELIASHLRVFLSTNYFNPNEPQYNNSAIIQLPISTSFTPELIANGLKILERIYKPNFMYKKAGVMFSGILNENKVQLNLFTYRDSEKEKQLMEAVDKINRRFGNGKIQFGATGLEREWKSRAARLSPFYTTRWSDIPVAKTWI